MKYVVIDTSNYLYRAYAAGVEGPNADPGTDDQGRPNGHLSALVNMLNALRRESSRAVLAFVHDRGTPRKQLCSLYKADRADKRNSERKTRVHGVVTGDDRARMFTEVRALLACIGGLNVSIPGEEADDAIIAFTQQRYRHGDVIEILSTDADLWELLSLYPDVRVFGSKTEITPRVVQDKLGVPPHKVRLHKTFYGDSSDGIPRVPRVRTKVLTPLLAAANSIGDVYRKLEQSKLSQNEKDKMRSFRARARMNHTLVQPRYGRLQIEPQNPDPVTLQRLLRQHGCSVAAHKVKSVVGRSEKHPRTREDR